MLTLEDNTELAMYRPRLEGLPVTRLPDGYRIRWYASGDERAWRELQVAADRYNEIGAGLFRQTFGDEIQVLQERVCFLQTDEGLPVGTAAAWWGEGRLRNWGRIHWVAILPEHQGRGLSKPLLGSVCERLRELGHRRAYLTTSAARVPALNLYRAFGFSPLVRTEEERRAWFRLDPRLKLGLGAERLATPDDPDESG